VDKSTQPKIDKSLMNKREVAVTNAASRIEAETKGSLFYAPRFMATLALPYRDPGTDVGVWERVNGNERIQIVPQYEDGKYLHPYGAIPRLLLIWLCTQATLKKSPVIEISSTLDSFLKDIGLVKGGKQRAAVMEQFRRLFHAGIRLMETTTEGSVRREKQSNLFVFEDTDVIFTVDDESGRQPLWGSTVTLSEQFYKQIKDHAFPLRSEAVRGVAGSPLAADVYFFLVYRLHGDRKTPIRITWEQLANQFGSQFTRVRDFKSAFVEALKKAKVLYKDAEFVVEKNYLVLLPSKDHIPKSRSKRNR
jgi:hypothetical protein